jgi:tripartite-type tricarboxylate transporter receptor subunit TctC
MKKIFAYLWLSLIATTATAQKPIEFVVPHAPGGVSDITTRIIDKGLPLGKYTVINKPGAGSQIGINHIMQQSGMLLATATQVFVSNPYTFKDLSYDPDRDLDIIATVGIIPSVLVCNQKSGMKSFKDVLTTNKSLAFGIAGYGSNEHLVSELLISMSKTRHRLVPYSAGGSSQLVNLVGGHIDCVFANYSTLRPFIDNPELLILISSHDLGLNGPTWQQAFEHPFPLQSYQVVTVPSRMNSALKQELKNDLAQAFKNKEVIQSLKRSGLFVQAGVAPADIAQAVSANQVAHRFIQTQNINLQSQ